MLTLAIPTFQCAQFVERTLTSLNAQGDTVRWWLQDGGSTDGTPEIARRLARAQDVVVSERDAGQTDALNRAFPKMGGELIGYINGDDCLAPGAAQAVVEYFNAHPEVELVYGEVQWIDADDRGQGHHAGEITSLAEVLDIYHVWWQGRQWVQPEVFFRRSLLERVGLFDTRYNLAFDYDFWVRCFRAGARVARLPKVLTHFRVHSGQKSAAARKAADEIRTIARRHLAEVSLPSWQRWRLEAELNYDEYQQGEFSKDGERPPLWRMLVHDPRWLLVGPVRARMFDAANRRLAGKREAASIP